MTHAQQVSASRRWSDPRVTAGHLSACGSHELTICFAVAPRLRQLMWLVKAHQHQSTHRGMTRTCCRPASTARYPS